MLLDIIRQFNWVDLLVVFLLIRICYVAMYKGIAVELFKLLGVVLAIYLSMHYYTTLSDFIGKALKIKFIPLEFLDFLFFVILTGIGYVVFLILREVVQRLVKIEPAPGFNRWCGLLLGFARGILTCALIVFMLSISSISYMKDSVATSYLGRRMFKVATATYSGLWDGLMSKLVAGEEFNKTILEVQEGLK